VEQDEEIATIETDKVHQFTVHTTSHNGSLCIRLTLQ
jgi:hypothetical protein